MRTKRHFLMVLLIAMLAPVAASAANLVFVHSPGCIYCEDWRAEVGSMYHKTDDSKRLPLREVNLDKGMPEDLKHLSLPNFTPTFIVVDDNNREVGRITGYNREFFWEFLAYYLKKMDAGPTS